MGCSMHAHIEVKFNNTWYHFSQPNVPRDYLQFVVIAGERMEDMPEHIQTRIKPVCHIHTLPKDMSLVTARCLEADRKTYHIHNPGVLTAEDLTLLQDRLYEADPNTPRTGIDRHDLEFSVFQTYINGNALTDHQGWDDLRVIFWFDN